MARFTLTSSQTQASAQASKFMVTACAGLRTAQSRMTHGLLDTLLTSHLLSLWIPMAGTQQLLQPSLLPAPLTLPNRTRAGHFPRKSKLHPRQPCPFSFAGSSSSPYLLDSDLPQGSAFGVITIYFPEVGAITSTFF